MRSIVLTCVVLFCAAVFTAGAAEKPSGLKEFKSVDQLAAALLAYFPKAQGEVTSVEGDTVVIGLGKKDGLMPGMVLMLWREGKPIRHPITDIVIGHAEEEVGTVEVISVQENSSKAARKKKLKEPRSGDRARINPKKVEVALVPLRVDRPDVLEGLRERLSDSDRCTVLAPAKVDSFLRDRPRNETSLVTEIGKQFKLDAVITIDIRPDEGRQIVTANVYFADDGRRLDTVRAVLNLTSNKEALGEIRPYFIPRTGAQDARTPALPFPAALFAVAGYDKEQSPVYVFSDGALLHIYREEPAGWREVWAETAPAGRPPIQHLYLGAADLNRSGKLQIFVTALEDGVVRSSVFEEHEGSYRRIAQVPGFLRIVQYPGRGSMLIGQDSEPGQFYAGRPKQYAWRDGTYVAGQEIAVPAGVGLYDFAFSEFGGPEPHIVALDSRDRLIVYSKGSPIWKSKERYRGVETAPLQGGAGRAAMKGRVFALDRDRDGKDEIIIPRNGSGWPIMGWYKTAELHTLRWTGSGLAEEKRETIKVPGRILDLQTSHNGKEMRIYTLVQSRKSLFKKQYVELMQYSAQSIPEATR